MAFDPIAAIAKEVSPIVFPPIAVKPASGFKIAPAMCLANKQPGAPEPPLTDRPTGLITAPGAPLDHTNGSPALFGAPTYVSGSKAVTAWGLGWVSDNDQTVGLNTNGSLTWTDGDGAQTIFYRVNASTASAPQYIAPVTVYSSMTAVSVANGAPTGVSERDSDGTTRLFTVFDSTSILRLSSLTDRNGNVVNFARDGQGHLTRVTDVHGRYMAMTYNSAGLVSRIDDSGGRTDAFLYDAHKRRVSETGPSGKTTYAYDSQDRLVTIGYPNGGVHEYTYDSQNRVATEDDGSGINLKTYSYGPNSTSVTDALGHKTVQEYVQRQGLKRPSRLTDAAGNVTSFTYDSRFNVASQTDALGRLTRFTYDDQGNVTQLQDAAGGTTSATYEPQFNQPTSLTDPLGHAANLTYDSSGNLTQFEDPLSNTAHFTYDSFGHVAQSEDPMGNITQYTYDPSNGALASVTDPLNRKVTMQTDALSRVTKLTDPAGNFTQYSYADAGDLTQVTDALGGVTQFTYAPGRTAKLLSSIKDALNHTTSMAYDPQGRLTGVTNALNQTGTIGYDAKSRIASVRTRDGETISMSYDALDRLTGVSSPEGNRMLGYDAAGNLTSVSAPNNSALSFSYDSLNRATGLTETLDNGFSDSPSFGYDANGNRTSLSSPLGSYAYGYDALNRLASLTGAPGAFGFSYDAAGRMTSLTYPNGVKTTFSYDAAGQVLQVLDQRTTDQARIASLAYAYDGNGNRTAILDQVGSHSFTYDALNRLTSASHPAGSGLPVLNESFAFDAIGNRTSDAQRTGYQYDAANRIVADSSFTYTSDANGNRTSQTSRATGQTTTFKYDSGSSLTEVDGPGGTVIAAYQYDPLRRRIAKTVGGVVTRFAYDNLNIRAILDGNNNAIAKFTYVPGLPAPLAMQVLVSTQGFVAGTYFLHTDALDSVVALTDASGNLVETYEYESFGRAVVRDAQGGLHERSTVGNPFMFAGTFYDPETGLYHMGLRGMDPETGTFLQEDPVPSSNPFLYASNRPTSEIDPLGLASADAAGWILRFGTAWFKASHSTTAWGRDSWAPYWIATGTAVGSGIALVMAPELAGFLGLGALGILGVALVSAGAFAVSNYASQLLNGKGGPVDWGRVAIWGLFGFAVPPALSLLAIGALPAVLVSNGLNIGLWWFLSSTASGVPTLSPGTKVRQNLASGSCP